ncbi:hypothetical protein [Ulvibacter antarcticus]|uniref:Uncharacterized protein n=1 Tax=Ulvibacter antarcticus TaxID=442714 RepID=A0A3L9Z321_9FLAO|nr:hypothetical protein [Ulvibacter antarcticus]RMA66550.1 hypothetical protein BXY75_0977 [Ulvibacter antarcticus]
MAKQSSIIKIEGTIDDLTFYKSKDGYRIRRKSGVSKDRIANDPAFARTRENGMEFGEMAQTGKFLRRAVVDLSAQISDSSLVSRVVKRMSNIKKLDTTSPRGSRKVAVGLTTPEGKLELKGFDFNSEAPLQAILRKEVALDPATGTITLEDFHAERQLASPQGATHASFVAGMVNVNFETGEADLKLSAEVETQVHAPPATLTLQPDTVPEGDGVVLYLLMVAFHQEMNGEMYPLSNGAFNALSILEVL